MTEVQGQAGQAEPEGGRGGLGPWANLWVAQGSCHGYCAAQPGPSPPASGHQSRMRGWGWVEGAQEVWGKYKPGTCPWTETHSHWKANKL